MNYDHSLQLSVLVLLGGIIDSDHKYWPFFWFILAAGARIWTE